MRTQRMQQGLSLLLVPTLVMAIENDQSWHAYPQASLRRQVTGGASCQSDAECSSSYCAQGICRSFGSCMTIVDCQNPSNPLDLPDCEGYLTCRDNRCTLACTDSPCPPDIAVTRCEEPPCSVKACDIAEARCVSDYCGGCNAIFIDPAGNQVCAPQPKESCQSDGDCSLTEFCSSGVCRDFGTCNTLLDCQNPSNRFEGPGCVGHLVCRENECTLDCTDSTCHPDVPVVRCFDFPCNVELCDVMGVRCVDDVCGGCHAIFIDPAGNHVCTSGASSPGDPRDRDPVKVTLKIPDDSG